MARNILSSTQSVSNGNLYGYVLPKGLVELTIKESGTPEIPYLIQVGQVSYVADPLHQYFFRYKSGPFTEDELTIEFSPQGFLKSISTVIDDQTGKVIDKIAELGSGLAEALTGVKSSTRSLAPKILFHGKIDPFDEQSMTQLNQILEHINPGLSLSAEMLGSQEQATYSGEGDGCIFYKPMGTCKLTLNGEETTASAEARIPHPHQLATIQIPQAAWVATTFKMDFDDCGIPTKVYVKKPSSAMAMIESPVKLLKALFSIPTQLIQLRVNLQNDRINADKAKLSSDQQLDGLREEMKAYVDAKSPPSVQNARDAEGETPTVTTRSGGKEPASSPTDPSQAQLSNTVKKLEQDLLVLRRRLNKLSESDDA